MAYTGFVGSGTVGHFTTTTDLQTRFPAANHAGRMATVEITAGSATHYFSDGLTWKAVPAYTVDGSNNVTGLVSPTGATVLQPSTSRIHAAVEAAQRDNAYINPPHGPAPTWTISTSYRSGFVVRGAAAGSTTNLYMCAGSTSGEPATGISAGSGGPTGTGSALITDNTAVWEYIGQASSTGTYPYYSTVTPAASTDVMDGYIAILNTGSSYATYTTLGLTNQVLTTAAPLVRLTNAVLTNPILVQAKNSGTVASPTRSSSSMKTVARFVTNCKKWIGFTAQNNVYQNTNSIRAIKVNGRFLSENNYLHYLGANVNPGAILLDLSTFPAGNKTIEVLVSDSFINLFYGIAVGADEFVYPLESSTGFKIALEGDSITDMTYLAASDATARYEIILNELLGCDNIYNNAIGTTGCIANASGTRTTYGDRLADIVTFAPDLLVVNCSTNDIAQSTAGAVRQALFLAYLRQVRAALPNCTICTVGINVVAGDLVTGTALTCEQDWKAAFDTFADANSFFVPVLTATPRMMNSANGYMFQAGGVPAAYTNTHPTSWYYYHIVPYVANAIRKFYASKA